MGVTVRVPLELVGHQWVMDPIALVFLILAALLFGLAAFGVGGGRINLVAAGLLAWVLATLLPVLLA